MNLRTITKKNNLIKSKLLTIIQSFSANELIGLEHWLAAPWCTSNKYYAPLCSILLAAAPSFAPEDLFKEIIFKQLYGAKQKYNAGIFNNLLLFFTKEVENYLSMLELQKAAEQQQVLTAQYFSDRKIEGLAVKRNKQSITSIEKKSIKTDTDFLLLHNLYKKQYAIKGGSSSKEGMDDLLAASNALDAYYLLNKYQCWHESHARRKILKTGENLDFFIDPNALRRLQNELSLPAIDLYDLRLRKHKRITEQSYFEFKEQYLANYDLLPFSLQQAFRIFCVNDAIYLDQKGFANAMQEVFYWYQFGLEKELIILEGRITTATFNNIILLACRLEKIDFLKNFIEEYKDKLPPSTKVEAYSWAMSQLAYELADYDAVLDQYKNWLPKHPHLTIQAKVTLLKTFVQLAIEKKINQKQFEDHCLAFEKYIKRNKLYAKEKSTAYLKFIQFARKIVISHRKPKSIWKILEQAIEVEPFLVGKYWLEKQIATLKNTNAPQQNVERQS